jgi:hypothetical protein
VSTLARIELEVAGLPPQEQRSLLTWLQGRLGTGTEPSQEIPESLKIFRELQKEVALDATAADSWKAAVMDSRR